MPQRSIKSKPNSLNNRVLEEIEHSRKMFDTLRGSSTSAYMAVAENTVDLVRSSKNSDKLLEAIIEAGRLIHQPYLPPNAREFYIRAFIDAAIHKKSTRRIQDEIFEICFSYTGNRLSNNEVLLLFILKTRAESDSNGASGNKRKHIVGISKENKEKLDKILLNGYLQREFQESQDGLLNRLMRS